MAAQKVANWAGHLVAHSAEQMAAELVVHLVVPTVAKWAAGRAEH